MTAKRLLLPLLTLLLLPSAFAQEKKDFAAEVKSLKLAFAKDQKDFYAQYQALSKEEQEKFDWTKHPATAYQEKFKALAVEAKGDPVEPDILKELWAMSLSGIPNKDNLAYVVDRGIEINADAALRQAAAGLAWAYPFEPQEAEGYIRKMLKAKVSDQTMSRIRLALAHSLTRRVNPSKAQKDEAKAIYKELSAKNKDTALGNEAKGALFALEHLQIGMKAPDFETIDENGKKWKLTDYKGKVVVLDFWGFW